MVKSTSSFLFGLALAIIGVLAGPVSAQEELADAAAEADRDLRESRAALTAGLDRIVERSALQYGRVRIARSIDASAEGEEPSESCSINVTVRTQEFDDMTMAATASTCAAASDMVLEGVAALVD